MIPMSALRRCVKDALDYIKTQRDVAEAEVFVSANGNLTARLNYTSHIPSNGVEEPKSVELVGVGIRVAFNTPEGVKTGYGSEASDLSVEGAKRALDKARLGAVADREYVSLPNPQGVHPSMRNYHDPKIMRLTGSGLAEAAWETVERALDVFSSSEDLLNVAGSPEGIRSLGLILGGDVVFLQERVAIGSTHMARILTDESTLVMSLATAMVEQQLGKGTGCFVSSRMSDLQGQAGAEAARNAISSMNGCRVDGGAYRVVLGPQPVTELLEWVLMPSLDLGAFHSNMSMFQGRFGHQVASEQLSLYDDGSAPNLAASKGITDEGLPTGRVDIISNGRLTGLLANHYEQQRILHDPQGREKLGVDPVSVAQGIAPKNGFRTGRGGGRNFESPPGTTPTNLIMEGRDRYNREQLLEMVGDGLYIGRIWYTYLINGVSAGDFSGTVVGDSYIVKNGRLAAPIKPNTLRLNDNIGRVISSILGIGAERKGVVRWSSDQITWAPEVVVADFRVDDIAEYMESVYS